MAAVESTDHGWTNYGEVFTQQWVVDSLLDLIGYRADVDLTASTIVEPSCGSGAFVTSIVERLVASAATADRQFETLAHCVRAFDLQPDHVDMTRKRVVEILLLAGCPREIALELATTWVRVTDFLLDDEPLAAAYIVGNPPYIRPEDVPKGTLSAYRARWSAMKGRADIYIGFIERMLRLLQPGGKAGFICADRWMRNQYGEELRAQISSSYAVEAIWSLHAADAFDSQVAAYPAIVVISRGPQKQIAVVDTTYEFRAQTAPRLVKWSAGASKRQRGSGFSAHRVTRWWRDRDPWPTGSVERLRMIEQLRDKFPPLESGGTRVSIGVATGADRVYLTRDPNLVEPDRLLRVAKTVDIETGTFDWSGSYLVNPWNRDGLVDLTDFPRLARYLHEHEQIIRSRHVAKRSPATWYRTIDNVRLHDVPVSKLLVPDMKATIHPVHVPSGYYPHHNLYYVTSQDWDLEVLGGLLLSRVAQAFVEAYCVRMRGNTLRFQAQYLRQIRVPRRRDVSAGVQQQLRRAFATRDVELATRAALLAYGLVELPE